METGQGGGDPGERHAHGESFVVQATPGIGKRTSAWLCHTRRPAKDCAGQEETSVAWLSVAMLRRMLRWLAPSPGRTAHAAH
jgi:hypothetical protein